MYCYYKNKIVPIEEVLIGANDLAVLRGYGVFDLAYARREKIFYCKEHLQRFQNSAKILNISFPFSLSEIEDISAKLLKKNGYTESTMRWVLTGGIESEGIGEKPNLFIINEILKPFPKDCYTKGVAIKTIDKKREIPHAKTLNYQIYYSQLKDLKKSNVFELLFTPNGVVLECATANIFIVKNKFVKTPKFDVLSGITRSVVIDLCRKNNINILETKLNMVDLLDADEVFVTSTTKKIMPVTSINDRPINSGQIGIITKKLTDAYVDCENNAIR